MSERLSPLGYMLGLTKAGDEPRGITHYLSTTL